MKIFKCTRCGALLEHYEVDSVYGHSASAADDNGFEVQIHCGPCETNLDCPEITAALREQAERIINSFKDLANEWSLLDDQDAVWFKIHLRAHIDKVSKANGLDNL